MVYSNNCSVAEQALMQIVKEAIRIQSRADFRAKMNISLKEASETEYWIEPLRNTNYITKLETNSLLTDCGEDSRDVCTLQSVSYLHTEKSETKVPKLPKIEIWLFL